jgi:hypothetical protein
MYCGIFSDVFRMTGLPMHGTPSITGMDKQICLELQRRRTRNDRRKKALYLF